MFVQGCCVVGLLLREPHRDDTGGALTSGGSVGFVGEFMTAWMNGREWLVGLALCKSGSCI